MGNYEDLKEAITEVIKQNGNQDITGDLLQNTLVAIVSNIGVNGTFAGFATPITNPGTQDANVFYFASTVGVYVNFGGYNLISNKLILFSNKTGSWVPQELFSLTVNGLVEEGNTQAVSGDAVYKELNIPSVYNSELDLQMFNLLNNRFKYTCKSYLQFSRVEIDGKINKISFALDFKPNINCLIKKFTNKDELSDPLNNGELISTQLLTQDNYSLGSTEYGVVSFNPFKVKEGELIGVFFYFDDINVSLTFNHFYFGGNPYPEANPFFWTGNNDKILQQSVISSSFSYYEIPPKLEYISKEAQAIKDTDEKINLLKSPRITLPKKLYATVGIEFNVYYDAISLTSDTGSDCPNYIYSILCPLGSSNDNRYTLKPDSWMIGTHVFIVQAFDNFGNKIEEFNCELVVLDNKNPSIVKNILCIGDSTTDDTGEVIRHLKNNFNSMASGLSPRLVGHKPFFTEPHLNHGASSGKTFDFYANGMEVLKINVDNLPLTNIGVYPNLTVSRMDGTGYLVAILSHLNGDGTGYVIANVWNPPSTPIEPGFTGSLATNGAAGWSTVINVTSVEKLINWSPFRLDGNLNIQNYADYIGYDIHLLSIDLGINDSRGLVQPLNLRTEILNNIKKIIDAFMLYNPSGHIMLCLPKSCSNRRSKNSLHHDTYRINIHNLRKDIIDNFDNKDSYPRVFVSYSGLAMDRKYGYNRTLEKVAERYAETKEVFIDDLHPNNDGYYQVADAMLSTMLSIIQ